MAATPSHIKLLVTTAHRLDKSKETKQKKEPEKKIKGDPWPVCFVGHILAFVGHYKSIRPFHCTHQNRYPLYNFKAFSALIQKNLSTQKNVFQRARSQAVFSLC